MRAASLSFLLVLGCPSKSEDPPPPKSAAEPTPTAQPELKSAVTRDDFTRGTPGSMPPGWTRAETNSTNSPATWAVITDETALSGSRAFAVTESENTAQTYNVALRDQLQFQDVDISVAVRAHEGEEDRGGGVVFRADGAKTYYIARWNPLEHNAKFYKVVDQFRSAIGAVETQLDPGAWHTLRVLAEGSNLELFIDDTSVLRVTDDSIPNAGAVGLWTKADAETGFDDFVASGS